MSTTWPKVRLGSMLTRVERFEPREELTEYLFAGTYSFGRGIFVGERKLGSMFKLPKIQRIRAGDFVYCKIMAWEGAFGLVPEEADGCVISGAFAAYEMNADRVAAAFLEWFFKIPTIWQAIGGKSSGTNVRRQSLHPSQFETSEIPLPPLAEQRRIVSRIEELASKIAEARALRYEAIDEAEALLTVSRRVAISECEAETVELQDVCSAIIDNLHSNPQYAETGIPCIRSPDVGYGTLNLEGALRTDEAEYQRRTVRGEPQANDIVLVREGGGTGKCALVSPGQRFSLGQRVMMLRPNPQKILPRFFLHQLLSPLVQQEQVLPLSLGSASPHLNIGSLKRFSIRLPSLLKQGCIVAHLDDLQAKIEAATCLQAETAADLDALLPAILDRAFKGEL
jgi:type I restriction enzyme S subunit